MLKDAYAALSSKFDYQNLETILTTIHQHFCDIFNLDILEQEAKAGSVRANA